MWLCVARNHMRKIIWPTTLATLDHPVIDDRCKLCEEMLFAKLLKTDTTGLFIFEATKSWFDKNQISLGNLVSCATDGALSMLGKQNGFIAHTKELCP